MYVSVISFFGLLFLLQIQTSSFRIPRTLTTIKEIQGDVSDAEESVDLVKVFRMSNLGAQYYHETEIFSFHQVILERANLYNFLLEISTKIEKLNREGFQRKGK